MRGTSHSRFYLYDYERDGAASWTDECPDETFGEGGWRDGSTPGSHYSTVYSSRMCTH